MHSSQRTFEEVGDYPTIPVRNVEFGAAEATASFGQKKVTIKGKLSLAIVDSVKYGSQIQLQVYSADYKLEKRFDQAQQNWQRVEIFFSKIDLDNLLAALQELKGGDNK